MNILNVSTTRAYVPAVVVQYKDGKVTWFQHFASKVEFHNNIIFTGLYINCNAYRRSYGYSEPLAQVNTT